MQLILALCFLLLLVPVTIMAQQDLTRYVDPFIGTGGHGHTYPGPTLPFGMVQLSPDTRLTGWDGCSGYHYSDSIIYGFSHTHLSGTGISDYGDILLMPTVAADSLSSSVDGKYATGFAHQNETARPGYYRVKLNNNILVELTATARTGFHRYTFPDSADSGNVIIDLTHRDKVLDSSLRVTDSTHIEGFRRSEGWARDQIVYFVVEFSRAFSSIRFAGNDQSGMNVNEGHGTSVKAAFRFPISARRPLLVKVAISAVSIDGARRNLTGELATWDFDEVKADADRAWNSQLNKIQVAGGSESQRKIFYTALYHTMLAPNLFMDIDGQYRGRDFKIHTAKGFDNYSVFSLWDTFRAAHPLYTLIDQKRTADFINTFLAQYEEGGRLPVWELAANETDTMIGYHAVSVIADAAVKGINGFDRQLAFAAMKHSAELKHFGLAGYVEHGYIDAAEERESVSRTLEYAYDDWCIAQMAQLLGRTADYNHYIRRAQSYKNVFDPDSGFARPRSNGGWLIPFDPREVNFSFTEANSWQYTFFVPQDIGGLIDLVGGKPKFARKLDELFTSDSKTTGRQQSDITGMIGQYAHGNEPSHHMAYLYDYVNQPWKTEYRVRQIIDSLYKAEPDGLSGNEDCGQMSAWYVLSAAGFYPVSPGSPVYAIGSPLFPEIRLNFENGRTFVIKAMGVSGKNVYIQAAKLNDVAFSKSSITQRQLMTGGELIFKMGPRPNQNWGSGKEDVPVSQITVDKIVPVPVIKAAHNTFSSRLEVSIEPIARDLKVRYTTDGSTPGYRDRIYTGPFFIDNTTTVRAGASDAKGVSSLTATAVYHKLPHNWTIKLNTHFSSQYTGGGDQALIDGIRGTTDFSGGAWQGYEGEDLVALVDLGQVQTVSKLGVGFLQDVGSWILMPRSIDFELSSNGQDFSPVLSVANTVADNNYNALVKDFVGTIPPRKARFVRIRAHNYGKLPDWHPGHGGNAWIFADEIVIE